MKTLSSIVFAALLTLSLFTATPARSADWSKGILSCDIVDIELSPWLIFWNWGKWNTFGVKFYPTADPNTFINFFCGAVSTNGEQFGCALNTDKSPNDYLPKWNFKYEIINYTFKPGTSRHKICEAVFNGHQVSKK